MQRLTIKDLRSIIQRTATEGPKKSTRVIREIRTPSLSSLLFEEDLADVAEQVGAKPVTLIVLYGPPAAGKGAAKDAVGDFAGIDADKNYEDWLDAMADEDSAAFFQEEDEFMVKTLTEDLPPLVFKELAGRVAAGEDFDEIVDDYYHVNESDKEFILGDILSKGAFEKLLSDAGDDIEKAAAAFTEFPNTNAFFTQARGFSKPIDGFDELNTLFGITGPGDQTLGVRAAAAAKYMGDVKKEIQGMGAKEVGDSTYASVYLMDQAGESSADTGRIGALGELREDPDFPSVTLIGVYIYQPQERTNIANLHRAATGGRRVADKEVQRIFDAAPTIEDGKVTTNGPAIDAMEAAGFDQIHVYYPPDAFEPKDAKEFSAQICQPLGPGTGALDIEGCEEEGNTTSAKSLGGMEKQVAKDAGIEDLSGDKGLPEPGAMDDEQKKKVIKALKEMGFSADVGQLETYLTTVKPPGIRGADKRGDVPWSKDLFGKGTNPTEKITIPTGESARSQRSSDDLILERWQKLAGILNDDTN
jgi:hypothetical protein